MTKSNELKEIIFNEMKAQGYSYRKMANKVGCHHETFARWKEGKNNMTLEMADKVLRALGISVTIGAEK